MEGALVDGAANQGSSSPFPAPTKSHPLTRSHPTEINKLAGDAGVPKGMDGVVDKEADQFIGGNASTGGSSGLAQTGEDGMINQAVNKVAGDFGAPGMADGMIDKEVDQEVNKFI